MTSVLFALALAPAAYSFSPSSPQTYKLEAQFEGFLPILGGNEGKVEVGMDLRVTGEAPKEGNPRATSEITGFSLKFNGAPLPFGLDSVVEFFPKATVTLEPSGKVIENTTPDRNLPIRLPGLDPKRLPDISFLPVELPAEPLEKGRTWTFERQFSGAPLKYSCEVIEAGESMASIRVSLAQQISSLENDALEAVADEKDAVSKVESTLKGSGTVWFSSEKGRALGADVSYTTESRVTPLKGGEAKTRTLATRLKIRQPGFEPQATPQAPTPPRRAAQAAPKTAQEWLTMGWNAVTGWWSDTSQWMATMRLVLAMALSQIPFVGDGLTRLLAPNRI